MPGVAVELTLAPGSRCCWKGSSFCHPPFHQLEQCTLQEVQQLAAQQAGQELLPSWQLKAAGSAPTEATSDTALQAVSGVAGLSFRQAVLSRRLPGGG